MRLTLLFLGKTRESWLQQALGEYLKRLRPFIRIEVREIPDVSLKTAGSLDLVKAREAEACLKQLAAEDYLVLLDERGELKTSLEFSEFIARLSEKKSVVFVIGGVYGAGERLRERADSCQSLSPLTFTHQLARLVLVEQLYRALMIQNHRAYHY